MEIALSRSRQDTANEDAGGMSPEELEDFQSSHALIQSKLNEEYAKYRKILHLDFISKSGKNEDKIRLDWMIDNHNFFRTDVEETNNLEKITTQKPDGAEWLELREHQRKPSKSSETNENLQIRHQFGVESRSNMK